MKLKLLEWNLNFGGDENVAVASAAKVYMKGYDVIIFTETVGNSSVESLIHSNERKYNIFTSVREKKSWNNQIVIAIAEEFQAKLIYDELPDVKKDEAPNFIQIEITFEGKVYQIIGTRIRISNCSTEDYKSRKKQFENMVNHIKKYQRTIMLGDFNNGMIKGNSKASYADVKIEYETGTDYETGNKVKSLLRFYNFHMMKEILGDQFILEEITNESSSWGLSIYNGRFSYGIIKNDQVISTKDVKVTKSEYSWDFVKKNKQVYEDMLVKNQYKKGNKIEHGFPDHAQLIVEVEL